jgi:hypothetical protein
MARCHDRARALSEGHWNWDDQDEIRRLLPKDAVPEGYHWNWDDEAEIRRLLRALDGAARPR